MDDHHLSCIKKVSLQKTLVTIDFHLHDFHFHRFRNCKDFYYFQIPRTKVFNLSNYLRIFKNCDKDSLIYSSTKISTTRLSYQKFEIEPIPHSKNHKSNLKALNWGHIHHGHPRWLNHGISMSHSKHSSHGNTWRSQKSHP
jgi:hypothetical protein